MELITEKLIIPLDCTHLTRRRLLDRLQENLLCYGATVITGRAGTGKTVLAAEFARRCGRRVAWYKVDALDTNLRLFLSYLAESVARACPGFERRTLLHLPQLAASHDLPAVAEAFVYYLQKQEAPLLLVLDDLHLVYDAPWWTPFFQRLLPLLTEEIHLLMLTRSLPPAPLWRLRSKQSLCVIDEAILALTLPETEELFARFGLSTETAGAVWRRTRGRVAPLDEFVRKATVANAAA